MSIPSEREMNRERVPNTAEKRIRRERKYPESCFRSLQLLVGEEETKELEAMTAKEMIVGRLERENSLRKVSITRRDLDQIPKRET
jgi:hypothetical protein